jgi:hypothetical protein
MTATNNTTLFEPLHTNPSAYTPHWASWCLPTIRTAAVILAKSSDELQRTIHSLNPEVTLELLDNLDGVIEYLSDVAQVLSEAHRRVVLVTESVYPPFSGEVS